MHVQNVWEILQLVDKEDSNLLSSRVRLCLVYVSLNAKQQRTHEQAPEDGSTVCAQS